MELSGQKICRIQILSASCTETAQNSDDTCYKVQLSTSYYWLFSEIKMVRLSIQNLITMFHSYAILLTM